MQKALQYLKKLTAKKQAMDETEYIMSSPAMVEILRQGEEDIWFKELFSHQTLLISLFYRTFAVGMLAESISYGV